MNKTSKKKLAYLFIPTMAVLMTACQDIKQEFTDDFPETASAFEQRQNEALEIAEDKFDEISAVAQRRLEFFEERTKRIIGGVPVEEIALQSSPQRYCYQTISDVDCYLVPQGRNQSSVTLVGIAEPKYYEPVVTVVKYDQNSMNDLSSSAGVPTTISTGADNLYNLQIKSNSNVKSVNINQVRAPSPNEPLIIDRNSKFAAQSAPSAKTMWNSREVTIQDVKPLTNYNSDGQIGEAGTPAIELIDIR